MCSPAGIDIYIRSSNFTLKVPIFCFCVLFVTALLFENADKTKSGGKKFKDSVSFNESQ